MLRVKGPNRLVKVRPKLDDVTVQTAEFDGLGHRMEKAVTNSGDYEETAVYLYDGYKIIKTHPTTWGAEIISS